MKIHEYQGKGILKKYGVTVPRGTMATSREEADSAAKELFSAGATGVVVKAQIHAGGRGKGGGVKLAKSANEAGDIAEKMLGMKLVTHQTGPEGRIVRRLLIEETLPIEKELYLGILVDRAEGKPVFMASAAGGMDIEQVAAENPDAILKQHIDPGMGLEAFQARKMAFKLALSARQTHPAVQLPSMATMDITKYAGGMPANLLDVGGGASAEQVAHAFEILLSDKSVKAVLINIFGGILRVDTLATGVVEAAKKTNIQLPIVLRLEGTNVDQGKKILMESGFNFVVCDTMKDAADKVVAAARG